MRTLMYIRVSTKEQVDEGNSLATQEKLCRKYADSHGLNIVGVFSEEGESAKTINRTELKKMMEYCTVNKKHVDAILFYRIDRLSRETSDYLQLKSFFNSLGIQVISASENIEDTPVGRFIENVLAGSAQFDNEVRAERSKNGMIDAVKDGRWPWKAPLGYVNTKVEGRKNIAPINDVITVMLIKEAWELIDNGYCETDALKIVTTKGLLNAQGKQLNIQHFSKMLRNKLYMGIIEAFGLTISSNSIVPLIDEALWMRVSAKLNKSKTAPARYKKLNEDFPLRGVLLCVNGHRMTGSAPRGNGGKYPKYHCPKCTGKGISYDTNDVDQKFIEYANNFSYRNDFSSALKEAVMLNLEEVNTQAKVERKKLNRRILELDAYDKEVTRKNIQGVYSDQHTKKMLDDSLREKTELLLELNQFNNNVDDAEEIVNFGSELLSSIGDAWNKINNIYVRSRFQKWLFPAGLVFNGAEFGTSKIPLCISIKKDFSSEKSPMVIPRRIELLLPG